MGMRQFSFGLSVVLGGLEMPETQCWMELAPGGEDWAVTVASKLLVE